MKNILHITVLLLFLAGCTINEETVINRDSQVEGYGDIIAATIFGTVKDDAGNPIEGVLVSDGVQTVATDKDGVYAIYTNEFKLLAEAGNTAERKRRFVFVTTPSEYEVECKSGQGVVGNFYQAIPAGVEKVEANFVLKKRTVSGDKYTVFIIGDPQIRAYDYGKDNIGNYRSQQAYKDMIQDLNETALQYSANPVYGITLGDMVHEWSRMWNSHQSGVVYNYMDGMKDLKIPMFHVIGNHDSPKDRNQADTDDEAARNYERYLGPRNYAVDLGKIHYIFIDNIMMDYYRETGNYTAGVSDDVLNWLKGHLAHISRDKMIMISCHSSLYRLSNGPSRHTNHDKVRALLSDYKLVHSWAGHAHEYYNYVYRAHSGEPQYHNAESHVIGRATGSFGWNGRITGDGAWRGYLVFEVDGDNFTWTFHPTQFENNAKIDYGQNRAGGQFRATYPNEGGWTRDGKVHVNVWMYDDLWGDVLYSDSGVTRVPMKREITSDGWARWFHSQDSYVEVSSRDNMFSITPSEGSEEWCKIEVTDRFGRTWEETLNWNFDANEEVRTIHSAAMDKDINVTYIVPDIDGADATYPVLYLLHGHSDDHTTWLAKKSELIRLANSTGMIIVCPDGSYSWYLDSPVLADYKYETFISDELVRYTDENFPTKAGREYRAVTGHSMGGHGALWNAIRNKDVFGAAGSMSGGVDFSYDESWAENWHLKDILGDRSASIDVWRNHTVMSQLDKLNNGDLAIIIDCGRSDTFYTVNENLHSELESRGISHTYSTRSGSHNWDYWTVSIEEHLDFFRKYFGRHELGGGSQSDDFTDEPWEW